MDSPGIYATDIMIIVNDAWQQSFARVDHNKKAISDRGWGPLNYNLLNDEDIKATMTDLESREFMSMLKTDSNDSSINKSLSLPSMETSVSDITADETGEQTRKIIEPNYDPRYLTKVISDSVTISSKVDLNLLLYW